MAAENDVREDFRPSERVAIAAAVAEKVGERRGNPDFISDPIIRQNIAELAGVPTKSIAAERAGFGNPETLRQAKAVVATEDSALIVAMDSGKLSISAAAKAANLPQQPLARACARGRQKSVFALALALAAAPLGKGGSDREAP